MGWLDFFTGKKRKSTKSETKDSGKPRRKRRNKAQIAADQAKALQQELEARRNLAKLKIETAKFEAELERIESGESGLGGLDFGSLRRSVKEFEHIRRELGAAGIGGGSGGLGQIVSEAIKSAPELMELVGKFQSTQLDAQLKALEITSAQNRAAQPPPALALPAPQAETQTAHPSPEPEPPKKKAEEDMSLPSRHLVSQLKDKTPEEAADWLTVQAAKQPQLNQLVGVLAKVDPAQLRELVQMYAKIKPEYGDFADWLYERWDWFEQTIAEIRNRVDQPKKKQSLGV